MNNDFLVTREATSQWFSLVTSSLVKIIGNRLTRDAKFVIHGNSCITLYFIHSTSVCWPPVRASSPRPRNAKTTWWRRTNILPTSALTSHQERGIEDIFEWDVLCMLFVPNKPYHAGFISSKHKNIIFYHFLIHIPKRFWGSAIKILPEGKQGPTHLTYSMSLLLITWWHEEPEHQQPWYWPTIKPLIWVAP